MTEYRQGVDSEAHEILDFANMVFSMADAPTDFRTLYPAVYTTEHFADLHMIAKDQERIVATLAIKPIQLMLNSELSIFCGYLGTVATHPYQRGKGHMRHLMNLAIERSQEQGMEMLALSGQRQRYNHYDFENAAPMISYSINSDNLKCRFLDSQYSFVPIEGLVASSLDAVYAAYQKLVLIGKRSKELFKAYLSAWKAAGFVLYKNNEIKGYIYAMGKDVAEMAIEDSSEILQVLHDWMKFNNCDTFNVRVQSHRKDIIRALGEVAENYSISDSMMIHVFNWQSVLEKLLRFKSQYERLRDGEIVIEIKGEARIEIFVESNRVIVQPSLKKPDAVFTHREAVTRFFSAKGKMQEKEDHFYSWFPLMFSIPAADSF